MPLPALAAGIIKGGAMALKAGAVAAKTAGKVAVKGAIKGSKVLGRSAARSAIRGSIGGGIPDRDKKGEKGAKISKEPIWSSGTTGSGEYLSSGDRKAIFKKSRAKISASSSLLAPKSSALVPVSKKPDEENLKPKISLSSSIVPKPSDPVPSSEEKSNQGSLEERVAANEKKITANQKKITANENKITILKSILKSQSSTPVEKSKPKISSSSSIIPVPSSEGSRQESGQGSLEKRVTANEKKITMLKRVVKTHQTPFSGGDSLAETNAILEDIGNALALDFSNRIAQRNDEISDLRSSAESKRRGGIESGLEAVNKISTKVGNAFGKVLAPARGILDKLMGFFGNLVAGFIADKALKWASNNKKAVIGFFKFLGDHGEKILIGLGLLIGGHITVKIVKTVTKVVKFAKSVVKSVHRAFRIGRVFVTRTLPRILKQAKDLMKGVGRGITSWFNSLRGINKGKGLKNLKDTTGGIKNLKNTTGGIKNLKDTTIGLKNLKNMKSGLRISKGNVVLNTLAGGVDFAVRKSEGQTQTQAISGAASGVAGGIGGAAVGGKIGASIGGGIGALFGGIGAVPGAVIGGALGTFIGGWLGADTLSKISDNITGVGKKDQSKKINSKNVVEKNYNNVVKTATSMNFSRNVKPSSNLQLPSKSGVTVADAIKLSDSARQQTGLNSSNSGDSLPMINSHDSSNSYVVDVSKDLLGIIV